MGYFRNATVIKHIGGDMNPRKVTEIEHESQQSGGWDEDNQGNLI